MSDNNVVDNNRKANTELYNSNVFFTIILLFQNNVTTICLKYLPSENPYPIFN